MRRRIERYYVNGKEFYVQSGPVYTADADITSRYLQWPAHYSVNTPNRAAHRECMGRYDDLREWKKGYNYFVVWGHCIYRFKELDELDTWIDNFLHQKLIYRFDRLPE